VRTLEYLARNKNNDEWRGNERAACSLLMVVKNIFILSPQDFVVRVVMSRSNNKLKI
jgi:hypothetical protein